MIKNTYTGVEGIGSTLKEGQ